MASGGSAVLISGAPKVVVKTRGDSGEGCWDFVGIWWSGGCGGGWEGDADKVLCVRWRRVGMRVGIEEEHIGCGLCVRVG